MNMSEEQSSSMLDDPYRSSGHRFAQSEIPTHCGSGNTLYDELRDVGFEFDLSLNEKGDGDFHEHLHTRGHNAPSAVTPFFQMGEPSSVAAVDLPPSLPPLAVTAPIAGATRPTVAAASGSAESSAGDRPRVRNHINPEMLASTSEGASAAGKRKRLSDAELTKQALNDAKRDKRILSKKQSATRSKERRMVYIADLERQVQTLQNEATALTCQLAFLQGQTTDLNYQLQNKEKHFLLQDEWINLLKEKIKLLEVLAGLAMPNGAPVMMPNAPSAPHPLIYPPNSSDPRSLLVAQLVQQLRSQSLDQRHLFQGQHHQLPLQIQPSQLQQPTGVNLAIQGDNHAADNASTMRR